MRYYYPLSSKDFTFENIFATESISPICFYSQRGFGFDYFYQPPGMQLEEYIILFGHPPKYELPENSGDAIKYLISVSEQSIDVNDLIFVTEGVFAYPKTIYFDQEDLNILFFRERDQRVAVMKSEISLPTKSLTKYAHNFKVIEEADCKEFELSALAKINTRNTQIPFEIEFDRRFNFFKGYLYGLTVGQVSSKSKEEIVLKRRIQEIINSYAELKSRSDNTYRSYTKDAKRSENAFRSETEIYEHRLKASIMECEAVFSSVFPGQKFEPGLLMKFLCEKFKMRLPTIEAAEQYVNYALMDEEIFGVSKLATLKSYFFKHTVSQNPIAYFEILKDQAKHIFNTIRNGYTSKSSKEIQDDKFKDTIKGIEKFIDQHFLQRSKDRQVDLSAILYSYQANTISIGMTIAGIGTESLQEFILVSNCILNMPKRGKSETSVAKILPVVEAVSNLLSKGKQTKKSQLYQYLNNEINSYSLDRVASIVMKNFVAFAFNPDSMEKLENFTESKGIEESWMSYAFWCAYNGFANTSRNFVRPVFESGNMELQKSIDLYLEKQFNEVDKKDVLIEANEKVIMSSVEIVDEEKKPATPQLKSRQFFDEFVLKTYDISFSDFQDLVLQNDKESFIKELKSKSKASKRDIEKLLSRYNDLIVNGNLF